MEDPCQLGWIEQARSRTEEAFEVRHSGVRRQRRHGCTLVSSNNDMWVKFDWLRAVMRR